MLKDECNGEKQKGILKFWKDKTFPILSDK